MRSSVADYQVIEALPPSVGGEPRWLCRSPERLELEADETVMVTELAVDASGWRDLASALSRLASIDGEYLLRLYEVGPDLDPDAAGVYLVSEAAPGGTASAPEGPFGVDARMIAVTSAARGAHSLHEAGLTHGSICPGGMLLTTRGAVLGPPRLGAPPGVVVTARGWRDVVSFDPDVLRGEAPSRASDVWSLAASLHMLLSDKPLYPGIDGDALVTAVQRVLFTRPEIDAELPEEVAEVLVACFAPDPADRPETALLLADSLAERVMA